MSKNCSNCMNHPMFVTYKCLHPVKAMHNLVPYTCEKHEPIKPKEETMKESCENCGKSGVARCGSFVTQVICKRCSNHVTVKADGWCSDWEPKEEEDAIMISFSAFKAHTELIVLKNQQAQTITEQEAKIAELEEQLLWKVKNRGVKCHNCLAKDIIITSHEAKIAEQARRNKIYKDYISKIRKDAYKVLVEELNA